MKLNLTRIVQKPGVYLLKDQEGSVLYVGKAINLKSRLRAYSAPPQDLRQKSLQEKIHKVETIEVGSEIEALVLEANLIKKHYPQFNSQLKDDKDYLYIVVTKEKYPKVIPVRKRSIEDSLAYFGPFPAASSVRLTLRSIRKIFPFSTCSPTAKKACLYYHLGLCPGVCVGAISEKAYQKNIKNIVLFLQGKKQKVTQDLRKDIAKAAKETRYEEAQELLKKLRSMEYILQPRADVTKYLEEPEFLKNYRREELEELKKILSLPKIPKRIEGYDISNIHGQYATGSMVVLKDGEVDKASYRKFKIKSVKGINDTKMLEEVLKRRFNNDWERPDLIVVDGGKGQLSACSSVLRQRDLSIAHVSLAKRLEEIYVPNLERPLRLERNSKALHLVQRLRDEAHRFAVSYHRKLRDSNLLVVT
ncbi:MAG: excinuclease ABC subunit UvrC [Candidatus Woykebacteria bacterium]